MSANSFRRNGHRWFRRYGVASPGALERERWGSRTEVQVRGRNTLAGGIETCSVSEYKMYADPASVGDCYLSRVKGNKRSRLISLYRVLLKLPSTACNY